MLTLSDLRTLDHASLTTLLTLRPDLQACPDLSTLAQTMGSAASTRRAIEDLGRASRQLLEAVSVLAEGSPVPALQELSELPPDQAALAAALADLRARFLLHPGAASLRLVGPVRAFLPQPLGLGRNSYDCHEHTPFYELQSLAADLGLDRPHSREAGRRLLQQAFSNTPALATFLTTLPASLLAKLRELEQTGPVLRVPGADPFREQLPPDEDLANLVVMGLVTVVATGRIELPAEVGLALRYPSLLQWDLEAHPVPHTTVSPDQVAAACGSAVQRLLAVVDAIAERIDQRPVPLLVSGGVGVKELRLLAHDLTEPSWAATVLALLERLGVVSALRKDLRTTRLWPGWAGQPDAQRWSDLVRAWQDNEHSPPPARPTSERRLKPILSYTGYDHRTGRERHRLVQLLGTAPTDRAYGPGWLQLWQERHPPARLTALDPASLVSEDQLRADLLHEAELLGLLAVGAATPLASALVDGTDLDQVLAALSGAGVTQVRAQADMTLVCTGVPSRQMQLALSRLATVESSGAGTVWRISERSLARAYDEGDTAEAVEAALIDYAGEIPQSMSYLVKDAARRHGRVRVGAATAYVVVEDDGLLRSALVSKSPAGKALSALAVRRIAPGVAVSRGTVSETVQALLLAGMPAVADSEPAGRPAASTARRLVPTHHRPLPPPPVRATAEQIHQVAGTLLVGGRKARKEN